MFTVSGTVQNFAGVGVPGLRIQIVDRNVGDDAPIADVTTDQHGHYMWSGETLPLPAGKQRPDLQARVYHPVEQLLAGPGPLAESDVVYDAGADESLNIVLPPGTAGLPSEYDLLAAAVGAHYSGELGALQETREHPDLTYLANKSGWDATAIAFAAVADQLSRATEASDSGQPGIPAELYYALFRAGLPADPDRLYLTDSRTVQGIWEQAIEQGIISGLTGAELSQSGDQFRHLGRGRVLDVSAYPGASDVGELAHGALGDNSESYAKFADILIRNRSDADTLWTETAEAFGQEAADRLQLDGKLAYLTLDNAPLMQRLHDTAGGLSSLTDLARSGYYRPEKWDELLGTDVPGIVPGATPEQQRAHYTELLAAQVRRTFPTAVVATMLRKGELPVKAPAGLPEEEQEQARTKIRNDVEAFLAEHQDNFDIGTVPLDQYLAREQLTGSVDQGFQNVRQQIKRIQRVYQITPTDAAMTELLSQDLDSAYRVAQHSEDQFLAMFADRLGEETARLTYAKAQQVHNAVLNVATTYLTERRAPAIGAAGFEPLAGTSDDAARQMARAEGSVLAYPTLENLFGSMDFCECEHCRSILSPAAYLVDLLQFLDRPVNGLSPQDVLLSRRPDIAHLALTCENTNIELPYIDLVNETLEYFAAKGSMESYPGHDTGGPVTSEELLASPQFVYNAVYDTLSKAVFPPPLPFHKHLETLRRYLQRLGTPLADVMEKLRIGNAVERPDDAGYGWRDILMEQLGMSRQEYRLLTDRSISLAVLYGYNEGKPEAEVLAELGGVRTFIRRLGISVEELQEILRTAFINPQSVLLPRLERLHVTFADMKALKDGKSTEAQFRELLPAGLDEAPYDGDVVAWIKDDTRYGQIMSLITIAAPPQGDDDPTQGGDPCSTEHLQLRQTNPDPTANSLEVLDYLKLLRFVRLWRRLGWTVPQTDTAISALLRGEPADAAALDAGFLLMLPRLAAAAEIMGRLGLSPSRDLARLLACWAPIATTGPDSLYRQLFLRPATSPPDPAFADNGDGQVLQDPNQELLEHPDTLRAAFNLTGDELADIIAALNYGKTTALSIDTISEVHRRAWLARVLRLSVRELLRLRRWTGLDPFAPPDPADRPIIKLLDLLDGLRAASLTPAQALYLIWGQDLTGRAGPPESNVAALARDLRAAAATIDHDFEIVDDPSGGIARTQMALVYGPEVTDFFFGLLDGNHPTATVDYTHLKPTLEPDILAAAAPGRISYDHLRHKLTYTGDLTKNIEALRDAPSSDQGFKDAVGALFAAIQKQLDPIFTRYGNLRQLYDTYAASSEPPEQRRRTLLDAFIPQLKARRIAQQAVTLTAAATGISGPLAQTLLADPQVLHADAQPTDPAIQDIITASRTPGLTAKFFWKRVPEDGVPIPEPNHQVDVVTSLDYQPGGPLKLPPNGTTPGNPISGIWGGWIEVPEAGSYSFAIDTDPGAAITLTMDGQPITLATREPGKGLWESASIELAAGSLHPVTLTATDVKDTLRVQWDTTGQGRQIIPSKLLYPAALLARTLATYVRFLKTTSLAAALRLSPAEVHHFATHPDYRMTGEGWLNALRAFDEPDEATSQLCTTLTCLLAYVRIRDASPLTGDQLIAVLRDPAATLPGGENALTVRLGWEPGSLEALLSRFGKNPSDLVGMEVFQRVHDAYSLVKASGIPAAVLIKAATNNPASETVQALDASMRARYEHAALLDVLRQINDELRTARRDALVAYILQRFADSEADHIDTPNKLFEFFLMDVEMDPCQKTTRIRHALSAVQLFVERCLMGLEVGEEYPRFYRLWKYPDHFYTTSPEERDGAIKDFGYTLERVEGYPFKEQQPGTLPLYRLGKVAPPPDHFYTIDAAEKDDFIANRGYTEEGIACWVFPSPQEGATPLYRLYKDPDHFYTISQDERERAISVHGYTDQGVACYVRAAGQSRVSPGSIQADQWDWMKRYRVWEANRKVFLWPENWLEPELRHDQSPFFTEVMSELLQGDITEDRAATAMIDYLSRLEEVAQLEPCGMHYVENNPGTTDDVVHIVARTPGSRRAYFYRRREGASWTPWEPINLDIEDNPVTPVVWNGRLFLFWLRILQETPMDAGTLPHTDTTEGKGLAEVTLSQLKTDARADAVQATNVVRTILCWSEYYNNQWQPPKTSDASRPALLGHFEPSKPDRPRPLWGKFDRSQMSLWVWIEGGGLRIWTGDNSGDEANFLFHNSYSAPVRGEDTPLGPLPVADRARGLLDDEFLFGGDSRHELLAIYFTKGVIDAAWNILYDPVPPFSVVQTAGGRDSSNWPFFFADSRRAYFVTSQQTPVTVQNFTGFGVVLPALNSGISTPQAIFRPRSLVSVSPPNGDLHFRDAASGSRGSAVGRPGWGLTHPSLTALLSSEPPVPSGGQESRLRPLRLSPNPARHSGDADDVR